MSNRKVIEVCGTNTRLKHQQIGNIKGLNILDGENIAIVGDNGSGKSMLAGILSGVYPVVGDGVKYNFGEGRSNMAYENIKYITFHDSYGSEDSDYYYQQRWNSNDVAGRAVVREKLGNCNDDNLKKILFELFDLDSILDKQLILLSSGEMRKFQLTKHLITNPKVLFIDNPFIGLDAPTRDKLEQLLFDLTHLSKIQIVIVLSKYDTIPSFVSHVMPLSNLNCEGKIEKAKFLFNKKSDSEYNHTQQSIELINELPIKPTQIESNKIVELNDVTIKYGHYTILERLNWSVNRGESWALSGRNGSGKSTLLSLICADNPQAYACNITLFGRKRGSGESIWDIKRNIGYSSPELHRSYNKNLPAINIVASGLYDTIGVHEDINSQNREISLYWMKIFGIENLSDSNFLKLSSGQQRLVLLARAFVKDPELLILDEPLHGLDCNNRKLVLDIINTFMMRPNKTGIFVTHYKDEIPLVVTHHLDISRN